MTTLWQNNDLFNNLGPAEIPVALQFLHAHNRHYVKGEALQTIGAPFRSAGIINKGQVEESCIIEDFNKIRLHQFFAGDLYGAAFAIEHVASPIQLIAQSDCDVVTLDLRALFNPREPLPAFYHQLMQNLTRLLARQNIHDTIRLHIANQKTIHDKLIVYLRHLPSAPDGYQHLPLSQTGLAAFLGVNRSALARAISRMRAHHEIEVHGNKVKLLPAKFHHD